MLSDWIWAALLTLGLWLEVGGWTRLLTRVCFSPLERQRMGSRLSCAFGFAVMAQFYFLLSLLGRTAASLHVWLAAIGIAAALVPRRAGASKPRGLHLKLARALSPLTWKRALPWLILPLGWAGLRVIDALLPHGSQAELSYNLLSPRTWLETGLQRLDPLHPLSALASVWEGLTFHVFVLIKAFHPVSRSALVRGQLAAQLIHLTAGQMLSLLLLSRLIEPFVRAGWNVLAHADSTPGYRHRVGMASSVSAPASLFFAWVACGQSQIGALASNEWGAAMFVLAALNLVSESVSLRIAAAAGLLWGSAAAACFPASPAIAGLVLAILVTTPALDGEIGRAGQIGRMGRRLACFAAGGLLGLASWLIRNTTQAGTWLYPYSDFFGKKPGWISDRFLLSSVAATEVPWSHAMWLVLTIGLPALAFHVWRARARTAPKGILGMLGLVAFAATGSVLALLSSRSPDLATAAALVAAALIGLELTITRLRPPLTAEIGRQIPYVWLAAGLFAVPLPFHLLWQDLPQAFRPADSVLAQVVSHFDAKLWASESLPQNARLVWTSDTEFYYLEQQAASIRESSILHDALARSTTPVERVASLCELGFDILAWEDRSHGPESAGLGTYLRLNKAAVLHVSDDVTFFDLHCATADSK